MTGALAATGLQKCHPDDRVEWAESNPEHWESLSLALYDEDLLARFDGSWDAPPELPRGWQHGPEILGAPDPKGVLATAYPGSGPSVWKDPRLCLVLPFWRDVLVPPVAAVFVWRSPIAVARSLLERDGMPLPDGLALWERYNRSAVDALDGVDTFVLDYESVVEDTQASLGDLLSWLGSLDQFADSSLRFDLDAVTASIAGELAHHASEGRADSPTACLPEQRELAGFLAASRGGHRPFAPVLPCEESPWTTSILRLRHELSTPNRELEAAVELLRLTRLDLGARLDIAQRELANLKASSSWRLTAPLRAVSVSLTKRRSSA